MNNFIKYNFTIRAPTQILYNFRTRKTLDLLRIENTDVTKTKTVTIAAYSAIIRNATAGNDSSTNRISSPKVVISVRSPTATFFVRELITKKTFSAKKLITFTKETSSIRETSFIETSRIVIMNEYRPSHINVKNVIAFAFLKMKKIYDARYQFIFFKIKDLVNLRLHKDYKILIITSKKIKPQLIKSFKILKKIKRLIYRMKLSVNMKIHDVIFITHLKSSTDPIEDSYRRRRLSASTIVIDEEKKYKIEKLLKKRIIKRKREWFVQYLIKWLNYDSKINTWELKRELLRHIKKTMKKYNVVNSNVVLLTILRYWENFFLFRLKVVYYAFIIEAMSLFLIMTSVINIMNIDESCQGALVLTKYISYLKAFILTRYMLCLTIVLA